MQEHLLNYENEKNEREIITNILHCYKRAFLERKIQWRLLGNFSVLCKNIISVLHFWRLDLNLAIYEVLLRVEIERFEDVCVGS